MAKYFEVSDAKAKELSTAVNLQDGPTAARLLEEVGSCGWSSLIQKSNQIRKERGADRFLEDTILVGSSEKFFGGPNEQLKLFERPGRSYTGVTNPIPLATVVDVKCERK
ncbi:MAG: hypothetical protein C0508_21410 [Cyanobacteria bacterium PR.023]|nr:hypothetical protein [Cyanobacteria bacterium PR.023]